MVKENEKGNNNVMKDYYTKNQECFDKAVLAIILAMPPFLVFIFNNIIQGKAELKQLFLHILGASFGVIILYLVAFILARNGCDNIDYAQSLKDIGKAQEFVQREKNRILCKGKIQTKIADVVEYLYFFLIVLIFIGIFVVFYQL